MAGGIRRINADEVVHRIDEKFRQIHALLAAGVLINHFLADKGDHAVVRRVQDAVGRVTPERIGIIILRRRLVEKSGELIKPLCPRRIAEAPFANEAGAITVLLEALREIEFAVCGRGIISGEQLRRGRRAVRAAGVVREANAIRRESVKVRRLKISLAVAAQVAAREVVALDENDAGSARCHGHGGGCKVGVRDQNKWQRGE